MYLSLKIDGKNIDINTQEFNVPFDYQLEDTQDFQKKKGSESIGLKLPATLNNQQIFKTLNNTSVEPEGKIYPFTAVANGDEIFVGKAIFKRVYKKGGEPTAFELNCFGNNADWVIDLKDSTLYDFLKHIEIFFDRQTIENSWQFDGRNELLPYVFAPVKYGEKMDVANNTDANYSLLSMRPSLSIYWLFFWGFKSIGYRIESGFFETDYFRKLVMPWTNSKFLSSEGTKTVIHDFKAVSPTAYDFNGGDFNDFVSVPAYDTAVLGGFDNNSTIADGDYTYDLANNSMRWVYNPPNFGLLTVGLALDLYYDYRLDFSSIARLNVVLFKNGVEVQNIEVFDHIAPTLGNTDGTDVARLSFEQTVQQGDVLEVKIKVRLKKSNTANTARVSLKVDQFFTSFFKTPIGGVVSFDRFLGFQKYKFLDFVRGTADLFNLSFQTDPINKTVLIEPTHDFSLTDDLSVKNRGYFTDKTINWEQKEDLSQESVIEIFDDSAKEFVFKFKDDSQDGMLKLIQDRYKITLGQGKYIFGERFKAEKKDFENRFFAPLMHYNVEIWGGTQIACIMPENINGASSESSQNVFTPKIAYYKGLVPDTWTFEGENFTEYPFMFSVNYKTGGENDPILSYSDEKIGNIVGKGLLKRFFWQRLAIMNNGQWLTTFFMLNNSDISNWFHREHIQMYGERWELLTITGYNGMKNKPTKCTLRKWVPITENEYKNTYPSETSILTNAMEVRVAPIISKVYDTQYSKLMILQNDIPNG